MTSIAVKHAVLSDEQPEPLFRYLLTRMWDAALPTMVWVMLNPSTADAMVDDPTILTCIDFARRNGFGSITVVNLFAFRSPHPEVMLAAADPVGPENDRHIHAELLSAAHSHGMIVAAWGTGGAHLDRDLEVVQAVEGHGLEMMCFGKTKDGHPKHPLARGLHRIPRDTKPFPLREPA
jgi:hypothetical protein